MSQSAPVVTYPIRPSRYLLAGLLGLAAAGLFVLLAWGQFGTRPGSLALASSLALWGGCAGLALWFWWQSPHGSLTWNGYDWCWTPDAGHSTVGSVHVHLDWQYSLWVRWQATDRSQAAWLWLEQRQNPAQWLDVRRALYAPSVSSPPTSTP